MVQVQELKKKYIEDTLNQLTNSFLGEEIDLNNTEIKKVFLNFVRTVKDIKEKEISFYNELLNEIPNLQFFEEEIEDLAQTKYFLSNSITSKESTINSQNFADLMKSSTIYYFINKKTEKNLSIEQLEQFGDLGLIKDYLQAIWPSAKQEELLGLLLYINSGQATKDYIDFQNNHSKKLKEVFLYEKFKQSLHELHVELEDDGDAFVEISKYKNKNLSIYNKMDAGCVLDKENKKIYVGFATAEYETSSQRKQYFEKIQALKQVTYNEDHPLYEYTIVPAYITNALINENDLKDKDKEQKKNFLSHFSKKLSKEDKNKINCLSFLSIVGNIKMPDINKGLDIKDLLLVNPYVTGADTLWIYKKFKEMKLLSEEEQYIQLRHFLVDEVSHVLNILKEKLPDFEYTSLNNEFGDIFKNIEKILNSVLDLFHEGNLKKENIYSLKFIDKITKVGDLYKEVHKNKFNMAMPKDTFGMQGNTLYNILRNINKVTTHIEDNNEDFLSILQDKNLYELNREQKLKKYKEENGKYIKEISNIMGQLEFNIFKKTDLIEKSLEEILCIAQLNPSRSIKKILSSNSSNRYIKNFIQNSKYWDKNKDNSYKNMIKTQISNLVFEYSSSPQLLIENLKIFNQNNLKKFSENTNIKFNTLGVTPQRKKVYKQLLRDWKDNPISVNQRLLRFKNEYFKPFGLPALSNLEKENLLIGFLRIKAEMIKETKGNTNSIKAFEEFVRFAEKTPIKNDPEFLNICEIALAYSKKIQKKYK